ncbi:MAG: YdcF family protein [Spirochaetota bacterium]|jgi:SanA protein|nr:YdcF family protein [Spirochaetota bacterium]
MNRRSAGRVFCAALLLGLLAAFFIAFGSEYVRCRGEKIMASETDFTQPVTIIVLGAAVWPGGAPSHMLEDRVLTAVQLYHDGKADTLLMSGNRDGGYNEPDVMARLAQSKGVPLAAIRCDYEGYTTRHTMQNAYRHFGARAAIVVTQEYHLPRALYLGEQAGMRVMGSKADLRLYTDARWNAFREFFARAKAWLQEL